MLFLDTETCGFHGICLLIQYAENDDTVKLWDVFHNPIYETLELIEWICTKEICGFNLAFDWFHLQKLYNVLNMVNKYLLPIDCIDTLGLKEPAARKGDCIKPVAACDLMLHARKGKYQSLMKRRDIYVRKVPVHICQYVHAELEKRVVLDDIYFARRKDQTAPRWSIVDRDDTEDFKDIVLRFKASGSLKMLAVHALNLSATQFGDIEPDAPKPLELGYAPFALAVAKPPTWHGFIMKGLKRVEGRAWPGVVKGHIGHWAYNAQARQYATDDVTHTRDLWKHLGSPEAGDNDSELACMVGSVRWRGYSIYIDGVTALKDEAEIVAKSAPRAPAQVRRFVTEPMSEVERVIVEKSTKKVILEEIAKWTLVCEECCGEELDSGRCEACKGTGIHGVHPAAQRAQAVLNARQAKSAIDTFNKLLVAGRFHASFFVIGARSGRMSGGGGGFNPQGVKHDEKVREQFDLADDGFVLCGGDFDSFEVVLAIAYYKDEKLAAEVKAGKKIHALFGTHVFTSMTYDEILADEEIYSRSKRAVFAMIYGGEAYTLKSRLGVDMETAEKAFQSFIHTYSGIGKGRQKITDAFCSMKQKGGIGSRIEWHQPQNHIDSMLGFRRDFSLENQICQVLFILAEKPPSNWKEVRGKCIRREREQTLVGATRSALFAAAFAIQAANMRAAGNHVIQSTGAAITKEVQRKIWDIQPPGCGSWKVVPMNMHDEVIVAATPDVVNRVKETVDAAVESFRSLVPLIAMKWKSGLATWADK